MQNHVRTSLDTDAPRVAELLIASRKAFLPFAPSVHSEEEIHHWVGNTLIPGGHVTVALAESVIVGALAVSMQDEVTWVDQLYIQPGHVGQGIGATLLALVVAAASGPIRLHTFQQHKRARRFYERQGFVAIEFTDGSGNEEKCPDVRYELRASQNAAYYSFERTCLRQASHVKR